MDGLQRLQAGSAYTLRIQTLKRTVDPPVLYNPSGGALLTLTDSAGVALVTLGAMTNESTGIYTYTYQSLTTATLGDVMAQVKTVDATVGTHYEPAFVAFVLVNEQGIAGAPPELSGINADFLLGKTWAAPGAIGTETPNSGAFTTLTATTWRDQGSELYNVLAYGLVANSAAAASGNSTALAALIATLGAGSGATIFFPLVSAGATTYYFGDTLTLTNKHGLRVIGPTLPRGADDSQGVQLMYTAATGNFLLVEGAKGLEISGLNLAYNHAAYASDLLKLDDGTVATIGAVIRNCRIGGVTGATGASSLVKLHNAFNTTVDNCMFRNAARAIHGSTDLVTEFATGVHIRGCWFDTDFSVGHIVAGGQAWRITDNIFEPRTASVMGAISVTARGLQGAEIDGNWFGDGTSGALISLATGSATTCQGISIAGNNMSGTGLTAVALSSARGVSFAGNVLAFGTSTDIDFGSSVNVWGERTNVYTDLNGATRPPVYTGAPVFNGQLTLAHANAQSTTGLSNHGILNYDTSSGNLVLNAYSSGGTTQVIFLASNAGTNAEKARVSGTGNFSLAGTQVVYQSQGVTGTLSWAPTGSNRTLTLPDATDTLVGRATTDTLTSKTLTSPIIANIAPGANFTLTQNAVSALTSEETGAIVNTLYLKAGKVGILTTAPAAYLHIKGANIASRGQLSLETTDFAQISFWNATTERVGAFLADISGTLVRFGSTKAGWKTQLVSGNEVVGLTVDSAQDVQFHKALVALGGGAGATLGTIGGSGPAAAGQNTWARFLDSAGAAYWVPVWK